MRSSQDAGFQSCSAAEAGVLSLVSEPTVGLQFVAGEPLGGDPDARFSDLKPLAGLSVYERVDIRCDRLESRLITFQSLIESLVRSPSPISGDRRPPTLSGEIHEQIVASQARQLELAARQEFLTAKEIEVDSVIKEIDLRSGICYMEIKIIDDPDASSSPSITDDLGDSFAAPYIAHDLGDSSSSLPAATKGVKIADNFSAASSLLSVTDDLAAADLGAVTHCLPIVFEGIDTDVAPSLLVADEEFAAEKLEAESVATHGDGESAPKASKAGGPVSSLPSPTMAKETEIQISRADQIQIAHNLGVVASFSSTSVIQPTKATDALTTACNGEAVPSLSTTVKEPNANADDLGDPVLSQSAADKDAKGGGNWAPFDPTTGASASPLTAAVKIDVFHKSNNEIEAESPTAEEVDAESDEEELTSMVLTEPRCAISVLSADDEIDAFGEVTVDATSHEDIIPMKTGAAEKKELQRSQICVSALSLITVSKSSSPPPSVFVAARIIDIEAAVGDCPSSETKSPYSRSFPKPLWQRIASDDLDIGSAMASAPSSLPADEETGIATELRSSPPHSSGRQTYPSPRASQIGAPDLSPVAAGEEFNANTTSEADVTLMEAESGKQLQLSASDFTVRSDEGSFFLKSRPAVAIAPVLMVVTMGHERSSLITVQHLGELQMLVHTVNRGPTLASLKDGNGCNNLVFDPGGSTDDSQHLRTPFKPPWTEIEAAAPDRCRPLRKPPWQVDRRCNGFDLRTDQTWMRGAMTLFQSSQPTVPFLDAPNGHITAQRPWTAPPHRRCNSYASNRLRASSTVPLQAAVSSLSTVVKEPNADAPDQVCVLIISNPNEKAITGKKLDAVVVDYGIITPLCFTGLQRQSVLDAVMIARVHRHHHLPAMHEIERHQHQPRASRKPQWSGDHRRRQFDPRPDSFLNAEELMLVYGLCCQLNRLQFQHKRRQNHGSSEPRVSATAAARTDIKRRWLMVLQQSASHASSSSSSQSSGWIQDYQFLQAHHPTTLQTSRFPHPQSQLEHPHPSFQVSQQRGQGVLAVSPQSSDLLSSGSGMVLGGTRAGSKSSADKKFAFSMVVVGCMRSNQLGVHNELKASSNSSSAHRKLPWRSRDVGFELRTVRIFEEGSNDTILIAAARARPNCSTSGPPVTAPQPFPAPNSPSPAVA